MLQIMNMKSALVGLCASLSLCVACGGSDGGNGNTAGGAGSGNPGAGGSNLGGNGPGNTAGGSGPGAGGAPSSNSGTFSSGLPKDKQLGALSDDESAAFCMKLSEYFADGSAVSKSFEDMTCRLSSVFFAGLGGATTDAALQASCKSLYDTCLTSVTTSSESCGKADASCTATVGEYDACVNDSIQQMAALGAAVPTCDKLTMASASELFAMSGTTASPASCQAVSAKCPQPPASGAFDPSASSSSP